MSDDRELGLAQRVTDRVALESRHNDRRITAEAVPCESKCAHELGLGIYTHTQPSSSLMRPLRQLLYCSAGFDK